MKRRDFIKQSAASVAAAGVLPLAIGGMPGRAFARDPFYDSVINAAGDTDRVMVLINLEGGNDGLNTVIPFEDPIYTTKRPSTGFLTAGEQAILRNEFKLRDGVALNSVMDFRASAGQKQMMKLWKDGKLAIVNNVGYADPNRSHFRSTDIWNSASDSNVILTTGWIGRYLQTQYPEYPLDVKPGDDPIAIQIGAALNPVFQSGRGGMGLAVLDPSKYNAASAYEDDTPPDTAAGAELSYVRSVLLQSDLYGDRFKALSATNKVPYPLGNRLADQLKRVAWCINAGFKTRVYFVTLNGFDTHVQQNSKDPSAGHGLLLNLLSSAIAAFQSDLEAMGHAERVIGMTYSEFGRRVEDNDSNGTDHGTCAPQFLFGNQINGELYGDMPSLRESDLDEYLDLKWKVDFRQLYANILGDWFGVSEPMRKAILDQKSFEFNVPVNGTSKIQSLIKTPVQASVPVERQIAELTANYPNPFIDHTRITFALSEAAMVSLDVYDARGAKVRTLVNGKLGRGPHEASFDAMGLASGTYYCRLETDGKVQTRAIVLAK
jgi:uncharacterized protein (DUF1501 family)